MGTGVSGSGSWSLPVGKSFDSERALLEAVLALSLMHRIRYDRQEPEALRSPWPPNRRTINNGHKGSSLSA